MGVRNILFVLCMAVVLFLPLLPEIIYYIYRRRKTKTRSFPLRNAVRLVLGIVSGIVLYMLIQCVIYK